MIWMALLVLVPLFLLALWALAVELTSRRGRRRTRLRSALTTHPVLGGVRELPWGAIQRVEDVKYAGPGVSGLYLYQEEGSSAVIDRWLPEWDVLRAKIRSMTPHADWSHKVRGWLVG